MVDESFAAENRLDLESKVLAAAMKQSAERADGAGVALAFKELSRLIQNRIPLFKRLGSSSTSRNKPPKVEVNTATANELPVSAEHPVVKDSQAAKQAIQPVALGKEAAQPQTPAKLEISDTEHTGSCSEEPVLEEGGIYQLFASTRMSSCQEIHVAFLRNIFQLLRHGFMPGCSPNREIKEKLRSLCVAHDILRDPATRADYDFRRMGVRSEGAIQVPDDTPGASSFVNKPGLRIGELLQCSQILEPTELEIAVDMHKATPEMMFGQFLVKSGFLSPDELDSALLGQRLILAGKITVGQFKMAMYSVRDSGASLSDTILKQGWIDSEELQSFYRPPDPVEPITITLSAIEQVPISDRSEPASSSFSMQNAVPSWANQLDWEDESIAESAPAIDDDHVTQQEPVSSVQAEPANEAQQSIQSDDLRSFPVDPNMVSQLSSELEQQHMPVLERDIYKPEEELPDDRLNILPADLSNETPEDIADHKTEESSVKHLEPVMESLHEEPGNSAITPGASVKQDSDVLDSLAGLDNDVE